VSGAGNQQERLFIEAIPGQLGSFLAGFALGEASFMVVCRPRGDYGRRWKISAAFMCRSAIELRLISFATRTSAEASARPAMAAGTGKSTDFPTSKAVIVPFFDRFPLVGTKADDFARFRRAAAILSQPVITDADYTEVLALREGMNNGGKRRYSMERILRDYTPSSTAEQL
jgi:hypothetical protein